jgi:hypothetical protein
VRRVSEKTGRGESGDAETYSLSRLSGAPRVHGYVMGSIASHVTALSLFTSR